jgi:hypothetical protein
MRLPRDELDQSHNGDPVTHGSHNQKKTSNISLRDFAIAEIGHKSSQKRESFDGTLGASPSQTMRTFCILQHHATLPPASTPEHSLDVYHSSKRRKRIMKRHLQPLSPTQQWHGAPFPARATCYSDPRSTLRTSGANLPPSVHVLSAQVLWSVPFWESCGFWSDREKKGIASGVVWDLPFLCGIWCDPHA